MILNQIKVLMLDANVGNDYIIHLCNALKKNSIDISFVVTEDIKDNGTANFPLLTIMPAKAKSMSKFEKFFTYYNYLLKVYRLIRKDRYDIVHFQFFRRRRIESLYFVFLKLVGIKLAHTVHDVTPLNENKLDHFFNLLVYKTADILFVHSNLNKKALLQQTKLNEKKIKVVPHGDFNFLIPNQTPSKLEARQFFGLSHEANVLLFFGAIKEYKGLDLLLNCLPYTSSKIKNLVLIIAGRPDPVELKLEYQEIILKFPKEIVVIYHTDFIPDAHVAKYFIASDVVVLPYRRISHSGILNLAYTFERPVIATNVGDFEEFIEEGKSGFVLSSNNQQSLSEKIIQAFTDRIKLERMGKYAGLLSTTKYTLKNQAESMKVIYEKMIENK